MTADDVVAAASECLNTPFLHQGRLAGRGLDCAGVIAHVMTRLGLAYEDMRGYPRTPYERMIEKVMDRQPNMVAVPQSEMTKGDILLMRFTDEPQHLAVHAGENIIHAYEHVGKCCEHRFADVWRARVVRVYRIRGLV